MAAPRSGGNRRISLPPSLSWVVRHPSIARISMTRSFKIAECKLTECDRDAGQILVAIAPSEQEKVALQEQFLVDDFDLSSVLDPDEVTRLESSAERMLLIWK